MSEEVYMSNVVPFKKEVVPEPDCSFCFLKKSQVRGKMLIKSQVNEQHICMLCVQTAKSRLEEHA